MNRLESDVRREQSAEIDFRDIALHRKARNEGERNASLQKDARPALLPQPPTPTRAKSWKTQQRRMMVDREGVIGYRVCLRMLMAVAAMSLPCLAPVHDVLGSNRWRGNNRLIASIQFDSQLICRSIIRSAPNPPNRWLPTARSGTSSIALRAPSCAHSRLLPYPNPHPTIDSSSKQQPWGARNRFPRSLRCVGFSFTVLVNNHG